MSLRLRQEAGRGGATHENELEKERLQKENQKLETMIKEYEAKIAEFDQEKQKLNGY